MATGGDCMAENDANGTNTALTYEPTEAQVTANKYLEATMIVYTGAGGGTVLNSNRVLITSLDLEQIAETVVPEIARAVVSNIASAISARVSAVNAGITNTVSQSNLAEFIKTNGEAAMNGDIDSKRLLGNTDFALSLSGSGNTLHNVGLWGKGEYKSLSGEDGDLDWEGDLTGFHLGADYQLNANTLIGLVLSRQQGDFDVSTTTDGEYELEMDMVSPYIAWQVGDIDFVGSLGYGTGEGELDGDSQDLTTLSASLAASGDITTIANFTLRGKGELLLSETNVDEKGKPEQDLSANRLRISVEASHQTRTLASGASLTPSLESAVRYNYGDGQTGGGVEVGGGLRYQSADRRVSVEGKVRGVMASDNYREWGVQGTVRVQPGADGQGLQLTLSPSYGQADSGVEALWRDGLAANATNTTNTTDDYKMRINTRLGYGITLHRYDGLLTPYSESSIGGNNRYRVGVNWKPAMSTGNAFDLDLMGEQSDSDTRYLLRGTVGF